MKATEHHLEALDVFRGATIAAMILVNNPGDWDNVFPPLMHTYWTGWTFADLVFPWFIFIMGVAMPFAFARRHSLGHLMTHIHRRIFTRVTLLIVLGLLLTVVATWPAVAPLRFPGVLQRIALAYLIAAMIILHVDVRGWAIAAAALLLGHWALLALVPFGGFPGGTLTPEHNLAHHVDTLVLGRHALYHPTDPEGLLGALPAAATALVGALAGQLVRTSVDAGTRLRRLVFGGVAALVTGLTWSYALPISKPLWTGSYVLTVSGLAMMTLALLYAVVDLLGWRAWARPFLWLGVNPLAIYCLSEVVGHLLDRSWIHEDGGRTTPKAWLFWRVLEPAFRPRAGEWASLAFGLAFVGLWIGLASVLYHRHIRIQV
jgi:predicted acyltransferase